MTDGPISLSWRTPGTAKWHCACRIARITQGGTMQYFAVAQLQGLLSAAAAYCTASTSAAPSDNCQNGQIQSEALIQEQYYADLIAVSPL